MARPNLAKLYKAAPDEYRVSEALVNSLKDLPADELLKRFREGNDRPGQLKTFEVWTSVDGKDQMTVPVFVLLDFGQIL